VNDVGLFKKEIIVSDVNWISGKSPKLPLKCLVRLRHRQELQKATIKYFNIQYSIFFDVPQRAVTPGQFAVFYKNRECLGGGVIK